MKQLVKKILLVNIIAMSGKMAFAGNSTLVSPGSDSTKVYSLNDTSATTGTVINHVSPEVSLHSFTTEYNHNTVVIKFNAADIKYSLSPVEIEHSLDGVHFEKTGVAALLAGDSATYRFIDKVRPATARFNDLYYRIKQTDSTGNALYSKIRVLRAYQSETVVAISITADPDVNNIVADLQLNEAAIVVMRITDKKGHLVIRKVVKARSGTNSLAIEGSNSLQPGTYLLEIIVGGDELMHMTLIKE